MAAGPDAAVAQSNDFTFKRVKPPATSATRRITIQIEPAPAEEPVLSNRPNLTAPAPLPERKKVANVPEGPGVEDWFWALVSPEPDGSGPARLPLAMQVLSANQVAAERLGPRPSTIAKVTGDYGAEILKATAGTQVSPALVVAVIAVESAGRPAAKSHAGAVGLMQLMPATAARYGVTERTDAAQSIRGGVAYLDFLLTEFGGDAVLALAGYNAGEGAVRRAGGVPRFDETRAYVPKVVAAFGEARRHCLTPPVRATDACLFTGVEVARQ